MRILVVFYSRTGTTKKVAEAIANQLQCEMEEIFDTKKRDGFFGYLVSGRDAFLERLTIISESKKDPKDYDLIIIGTPVWAGNISTPIRTYIVQNKEYFKRVVFFATYENFGGQRVLRKMAKLCKQEPVALLLVKRELVERGEFIPLVAEFSKGIKL